MTPAQEQREFDFDNKQFAYAGNFEKRCSPAATSASMAGVELNDCFAMLVRVRFKGL